MSVDDFEPGKIDPTLVAAPQILWHAISRVYSRIVRRSPNLMSYQQQISVTTKGHGDMHDLTEQVTSVVNASGTQTGTVNIFNVGSTAAIGTIEFEPGLQHDLPAILDKLIPPSRSYGHEQTWHDGNGHAHLQATLLGPSVTVPISDGKLVLGTWQQIFHLECDVHRPQGSRDKGYDGPRSRGESCGSRLGGNSNCTAPVDLAEGTRFGLRANDELFPPAPGCARLKSFNP